MVSRESRRVARLQPHPVDLAARPGDLALSLDAHFVDRFRQAYIGLQAHVVQRGRQHPPLHRQHPSRFGHRLFEAAGDLRHGRDEQVAEGMPVQPLVPIREAVLEQLAEHGFVVGERRQAVADVAGRQHAQLARSLPEEPPSSATVTMAVMLRE